MDKKIAIVNDILHGAMGEKVFWDFMLEYIPNIHGVDKSLTNNFKKYIDEDIKDVDVIIQNATFIDMVDSDIFTVSFLQDNLRAMGRNNLSQEYTLNKSNIVVSNSKLTASSYPEFNIKIIPIGVDDRLFYPTLTRKNQKTTGIFIGNLNEIKGWSRIKNIIDKRKDINWIVVSKGKTKYKSSNVAMYNRISQKLLSELINISHFFILGSPIETECLAAIESCMCDVPVVMHNTGIFADFSCNDKKRVGYIGDNLEDGIEEVLSNKYSPREVMIERGLNINGMISKWKELLESI